MLRRRTSQGRC